jgi:hypothetical protein
VAIDGQYTTSRLPRCRERPARVTPKAAARSSVAPRGGALRAPGS